MVKQLDKMNKKYIKIVMEKKIAKTPEIPKTLIQKNKKNSTPPPKRKWNLRLNQNLNKVLVAHRHPALQNITLDFCILFKN